MSRDEMNFVHTDRGWEQIAVAVHLDTEAMLKRTKAQLVEAIVKAMGRESDALQRAKGAERELQEARANQRDRDEVLRQKIEELSLVRRMCRALIDATSPACENADVD
jgi:hypothetical protein